MVDVGTSGHLAPGTVLIGKYEIVRPIGRGGFGLVYEARHRGLGTGVAVKVLNAEGRQNPKTVARFQQEAWTAARIASDNVVRVTDIDVAEDGAPFLVMELLIGRDLERELELRRRIPSREAVDYLLQAAAGLRAAHRNGVVHRDLKTSNLFLVDEQGERRVKVLDFGLSKIAASLGMTSTNMTLGTPFYSAPEQLRSAKAADARADVWSLGVIAYQLLSGRLPFPGPTIRELFTQVTSREPPELGLVAPDVPAGLCAAVARALQKTPERRFQSMDAFAEAVAPFGTKGPDADVGALRAPDLYPMAPGPSSTFLDSSHDTPPERRTSRLWTGVVAGAVAVLITMAVGVRFAGHLLAPSTPRQGAAPSTLVTPEPLAPKTARVETPGVAPSSAGTAPPAAAPSASASATARSKAVKPQPVTPLPAAPPDLAKDLGF